MKKSLPVAMKKISGSLPAKNLSLDEAKAYLKITETEYRSPESLIESIKGLSYYHPLFDKGADIYPRNLWFVKLVRHGILGFNPQKPFVKTDESIGSKPPWNRARVEGNVEREFLFATILGEDLIPFGLLGVKPVVLPIVVGKGVISIIRGSKDAKRIGYDGLADYLARVERMWEQFGKDKKLDLYEWIDFRRKLTKQHPTASFKVLYTGSATYLTSAAVDQSRKFSVELDGSRFELKGFIAESKTYQYETNDINEANYLVAILNSKVVDDAIKPLQTRGLWGARDIHKRPLLLPIPKFKKTDPTHKRIAELGKIAHEKVQKEIPKLTKYKSIGKARSEIRELLKDEIVEIDNLAVKMMFHKSNPKGLAQYIQGVP